MTVSLVGAGPGDPGLLTVRGRQLLGAADVVVHDRLVDARLIRLAPPSAERIDVGKAPGGPVDQDAINALLVERGATGAAVVRLKGGDPFVFGRGGEEAQALAAAGIDFEVVPGITSAVAAPAYAGIPVTHRGLSTSFTVVTGHSRNALDRETNWEALAAVGGTIVVLMGVAHRARIAERLMAGGLDPVTPVAAVRWGSRPDQTCLRTTLAALGTTDLEPPVTLVVGAVAGLDLAWFDRRPLFGRRVIVTRARSQASVLSARLAALGAIAVEIPTIAIAPPADGGSALARAGADLTAGRYGWVALTSANAARRLLDAVPDGRSFATSRIAAIGPGTASVLADAHLLADLVPARSVAEGLLAAWPCLPDASAGPGARRVLLARAAVARDTLPAGLATAGWEVDVVEAYRTVAEVPPAAVLAEIDGADAICFTSASTVAHFLAAAGHDRLPPVVVCIGPATEAAARAGGIAVTTTASEHNIPGLVEAVATALTPVRG